MQIYMKDGKALKVGGYFVKPAGGGQTGETWIWNETVSVPRRAVSYTVSFASNNIKYDQIGYGMRPISGMQYFIEGDFTYVYNVDNGWVDQAYRTITFFESPSGDLLTFLQANATKQ